MIRNLEEKDINLIVNIDEILLNENWGYADFSLTSQGAEIRRFFVLEEEQEIIGYCGYYKVDELGMITKVAVIKAKQGIGKGKELFNYLIEYAKKDDIAVLELEVNENNLRAFSLYEKCGFKKVRVRKGYYNDGKENALVMQLQLREGIQYNEYIIE
jgi:ribosomal-protein-alanine N-acetyltransferase